MLLRLTSIVALGLALALSARVAHADPLLDGIAKMPGGVEDVRIGGTWEKDGKSGAYRVVIARSGGDTVTARLFVQWIAYHDDGDTTVENTIEIKELAALKVDIVDFTSESDQDGLSVYHRDPRSERQRRPELRAACHVADRISLRTGKQLGRT